MERGFGRRKEYIVAKNDPHGSFSFAIELENLFGFCEVYDKVVYGIMRHKLTPVRKNNDDAIFKISTVDKGKGELTKVAWVMPRVHPNDVHLSATQVSVVLNDTKYPVRDVIAGFKKHRYVEYYKMFTEFARDYYGVDPLIVSNLVDIITYEVFYFDVSRQSERVSQSVVDIKNAICGKCGSKCRDICTRHQRPTTQIPQR